MEGTFVEKGEAFKVSNRLKVRVIKKYRSDADREEEQSVDADPFSSMYAGSGELQIIEPPVTIANLATMRDISSELGPDIDAMKVNIERTGWRIMARPNVIGNNESMPLNVATEIDDIEAFFSTCVLDQEVGTFTELRSRMRDDLEMTGQCYVEVLPQRNDKLIPAGLKHISSWTMRITGQDKAYTEYKTRRAIKKNGKWVMEGKYASKRFRRYVQVDGTNYIYFKEWDDPRKISSKTGQVISAENNNLNETEAHEVIFKRIYCSTSPYGKPHYYGSVYSIYGVRGAEEINYVSLDNNQIPAIAILATNVEVTDGSIDRLNEFLEERQGDRNYSRIVIIESEPIGEGMKDPTSMKMDIKPLTSEQHTDAMFANYMDSGDKRVRRSYRLPPIMVGAAEEYTKATANASKLVAEQQIFVPERDDIDALWTNTIIARLGKASVVFKSRSPELTDGFELTQLLATAEASGGLTPRISRMIVEDVTNLELPEPDESIKPDVPFSLTKEQERAKMYAIAQESSTNTPVLKKTDGEKEEFIQKMVNSTIANPNISDAARIEILAQIALWR